MNDIKRQLNKPLIIITFIIVVLLGKMSHMKELFHMNDKKKLLEEYFAKKN